MTHEYKPGEWAAVRVVERAEDGCPRVEIWGPQGDLLPIGTFRPLPPEEHHKFERDAVIEAAKGFWGHWPDVLIASLGAAVDALFVAETRPPKMDTKKLHFLSAGRKAGMWVYEDDAVSLRQTLVDGFFDEISSRIEGKQYLHIAARDDESLAVATKSEGRVVVNLLWGVM